MTPRMARVSRGRCEHIRGVSAAPRCMRLTIVWQRCRNCITPLDALTRSSVALEIFSRRHNCGSRVVSAHAACRSLFVRSLLCARCIAPPPPLLSRNSAPLCHCSPAGAHITASRGRPAVRHHEAICSRRARAGSGGRACRAAPPLDLGRGSSEQRVGTRRTHCL